MDWNSTYLYAKGSGVSAMFSMSNTKLSIRESTFRETYDRGLCQKKMFQNPKNGEH
jgi:hypothetical protein